jgi:hypothetical protein
MRLSFLSRIKEQEREVLYVKNAKKSINKGITIVINNLTMRGIKEQKLK